LSDEVRDRRAVRGGGSRSSAAARPPEDEEGDPGRDEDGEDGGDLPGREGERRRVEGGVGPHGAIPLGDVARRVPGRGVERGEVGEDGAEDDRAEAEAHEHHPAREAAALWEPPRHGGDRRDVGEAVAEPAEDTVGAEQPPVPEARRAEPREQVAEAPERHAGEADDARARAILPAAAADGAPAEREDADGEHHRYPEAAPVERRGERAREEAPRVDGAEAEHHQDACQGDEPAIGGLRRLRG
jgi:hypothetical protein